MPIDIGDGSVLSHAYPPAMPPYPPQTEYISLLDRCSSLDVADQCVKATDAQGALGCLTPDRTACLDRICAQGSGLAPLIPGRSDESSPRYNLRDAHDECRFTEPPSPMQHLLTIGWV